MLPKRNRSRALLVASLLALLGIIACSKSYSPTEPYRGGSGGGGSLFNFGPLALGQSVSFTFANAGTQGYHCITHRSMGMTGTVQVDATGADSLVVQLTTADKFSPSTAHLKPGGHVRWVNVSNRTDHTVTSD